MRIILTIVLTLTAANSFAAEGDWVFAPGDYTHDPYTGQRVTQFAPDAVAVYPFGRNYQRSGYRYSNSTLRIGNSVDRYSTVETWGNGAVALGSTLMFQPYDDRGDDTVGPENFRRHRKRLHRDYHDIHPARIGPGAAVLPAGGGPGRRGSAAWAAVAQHDNYINGPSYGWGNRGYGPGFGGPGFVGPGYGRGPVGAWGPGGWGGPGWGPGFGWGAGAGAGVAASGYAGNHGRVQWDKDSGSVEWGLDRAYDRNAYGYSYGVPWNGGWGRGGGHRGRPRSGGGGRGGRP